MNKSEKKSSLWCAEKKKVLENVIFILMLVSHTHTHMRAHAQRKVFNEFQFQMV